MANSKSNSPGYDMDEVLEEFGDVDFDKAEEGGGMDLGADADEAPIIKLVNMILLEAIKRNASDIHVEPYEKDFRIRYRIDGVLYEQMRLPLKQRSRSRAVSKSSRTSTSPSVDCPKMVVSSSSSVAGERWTIVSPFARRSSAKRRSCACSISRTCSST